MHKESDMKQVLGRDESKWMLTLLNNVFEIEKKISLHGDKGNVMRNIEKIKEAFLKVGLFYEDPIGQKFSETRSDLEATISGSQSENLVVVEVIKPIIRNGKPELSWVVQKGLVLVEGKA